MVRRNKTIHFSEHSSVNICCKLYLLQTQSLLAVTLSLDGLAKQLVKQMVFSLHFANYFDYSVSFA